MLVVRGVAAEEVVAPGVSYQDGDSTAGDRFHVFGQRAALVPPVVEVPMENGCLVFGKRPSLATGAGQHPADVPEVGVAVAAGDIRDDRPEVRWRLLRGKPLADPEQ